MGDFHCRVHLPEGNGFNMFYPFSLSHLEQQQLPSISGTIVSTAGSVVLFCHHGGLINVCYDARVVGSGVAFMTIGSQQLGGIAI